MPPGACSDTLNDSDDSTAQPRLPNFLAKLFYGIMTFKTQQLPHMNNYVHTYVASRKVLKTPRSCMKHAPFLHLLLLWACRWPGRSCIASNMCPGMHMPVPAWQMGPNDARCMGASSAHDLYQQSWQACLLHVLHHFWCCKNHKQGFLSYPVYAGCVYANGCTCRSLEKMRTG